METISKKFTDIDLFGMIIPGIVFLYGLGYMIGSNNFNFFLIYKGDIISKIIIFLALSYLLGTAFSSIGTLVNYLVKPIFTFFVKKNDIYDSNKDKINKIIQETYGFECSDKSYGYIIGLIRRIMKLKIEYCIEIDKFANLRAITKSMVAVITIIMCIQLYYARVPVYYYVFEILLDIIFIFRMMRMEDYYHEYLIEYFLIAHR